MLNFPVLLGGSNGPASWFRVQQSWGSSGPGDTNATTYFIQGGNIAGATTNDWSKGAPSLTRVGIIASNIVSGVMSSNLTDATIEQHGGTIAIADGTAATRPMAGGTHYLLAGGVFTRTTAHVLRLGDTTAASDVVFQVAGGSLILTNASSGLVFMGTDSQLEMIGGIVDCGANRLDLHTTSAHTDTPFLTFVEDGAGSVTCGSISIAANVAGYNNFEDNTTGTFTVNGPITFNGTNTTFQGLWDLGRLRFQGANMGSFTNVFQVAGSTLSLR